MLARMQILDILHIVGRNIKWHSLSGKHFDNFLIKHRLTIQSNNCIPGHLSQRSETLL